MLVDSRQARTALIFFDALVVFRSKESTSSARYVSLDMMGAWEKGLHIMNQGRH